MRTVEVHCDDAGQIVSIVEAGGGDGDGPRAGVAPSPGGRVVQVTLEPEHEGLSLLDLHEGFTLELGGDRPRLVPRAAAAARARASDKGAGPRFEAVVDSSDGKAVDQRRLAELDIDRVPDPDGRVRAIIDCNDAALLVESGFEVRLVGVVPRRPLDPGLVADDDQVRAWLDERLEGIAREDDG
jgi:hypothetical protein